MKELFGVEAVRTAIRNVDLARELGISQQAVGKWKHVPVVYVKRISDITGLPKHVIRPDVYDRGD